MVPVVGLASREATTTVPRCPVSLSAHMGRTIIGLDQTGSEPAQESHVLKLTAESNTTHY